MSHKLKENVKNEEYENQLLLYKNFVKIPKNLNKMKSLIHIFSCIKNINSQWIFPFDNYIIKGINDICYSK